MKFSFHPNCFTASFFCTTFRKIVIIPIFLILSSQFVFLLDSKFRTPKNYRWHIWKRGDGSLIPRSEFLLGIVRVYYYFYYYYYKSELKMQKKPGFWVVPWAAQGIEAHHSDGSGRIFWFFGFWSLPPSLFFHIWLVFEKKIVLEHWIMAKKSLGENIYVIIITFLAAQIITHLNKGYSTHLVKIFIPNEFLYIQ